jgi:thioesterase domain-containing protein
VERLRARLGPADPADAAWHDSWGVFNAYRLSPYDGAATYYLAEQQLPFVGNNLDAWRRSAPNLLVTRVPGVHDELLSEAYVPHVAARISATLR